MSAYLASTPPRRMNPTHSVLIFETSLFLVVCTFLARLGWI